MAKINRVIRSPIWQVKIEVTDPNCIWNVNPSCSFYKIIKANNVNAAVRGAATYCNRRMKEFPGVHFKYSTHDVKEYFYPINSSFNESQEKSFITRSKY
jgi:hypothetical protein